MENQGVTKPKDGRNGRSKTTESMNKEVFAHVWEGFGDVGFDSAHRTRTRRRLTATTTNQTGNYKEKIVRGKANYEVIMNNISR